MAYSNKVIDHYENPRNVGSLPKDDANVGTGLVADVAARQDAEVRAQRLAERAHLQAEAMRWAAAVAPLNELSQLLDGLTAATLIAAGYHQHHRGAWRKRRHGPQR